MVSFRFILYDYRKNLDVAWLSVYAYLVAQHLLRPSHRVDVTLAMTMVSTMRNLFKSLKYT